MGRACTGSPFVASAVDSMASARRLRAVQVASRGAATVVAKYAVTPCVVRNVPRRGSSEVEAPITSSPAPPCMWISRKPGANMPSPKSSREVFAGSSFAERVEISEIRPSSTMSSGFAISSAGVNRRLAVNAVFMGKWNENLS